jgi:hypothetical protein
MRALVRRGSRVRGGARDARRELPALGGSVGGGGNTTGKL